MGLSIFPIRKVNQNKFDQVCEQLKQYDSTTQRIRIVSEGGITYPKVELKPTGCWARFASKIYKSQNVRGKNVSTYTAAFFCTHSEYLPRHSDVVMNFRSLWSQGAEENVTALNAFRTTALSLMTVRQESRHQHLQVAGKKNWTFQCADGKTLMAHGEHLGSSQCEYFANAIKWNSQASREDVNCFDFSAFSRETVEELMLFLYTGKTRKLPPEKLFKLYELADFIAYDSLKEACRSSIVKAIKRDPVAVSLNVIMTFMQQPHKKRLPALSELLACAFLENIPANSSFTEAQKNQLKGHVIPLLLTTVPKSVQEKVSLDNLGDAFYTLYTTGELPDDASTKQSILAMVLCFHVKKYGLTDESTLAEAIFSYATTGFIPVSLSVKDKLALAKAAEDCQIYPVKIACLMALHNNDGGSLDRLIDNFMEYFSLPASQRKSELEDLLVNNYTYLNPIKNKVPKSKQEAFFKLMETISPQTAAVRILIARCYRFGVGVQQNDEECKKLLLQCIQEEYAPAYRALGVMYHFGLCGVEKDPLKAVSLYKQAIRKNDLTAQSHLAQYYYYSYYYDQRALAKKMLEESGSRGEPFALLNLSTIIYNEMDNINIYPIEKSKLAFKYMLQSARITCDHYAQLSVARYYGDGLGVKEDFVQARIWAIKAHDNGNEYAEAFIQRLP